MLTGMNILRSLNKYGLEEYLSIFQKYLDSFYEAETNTDTQKGE